MTWTGADRKTIRYQSRRAPDTALRGRLRDLANERRRFGYRRLFVLLRREGKPSGINRIYRLYSEEGLTGPMVREALAGIRATVAAARLRSNIGPPSLTSQQITAALKEAHLGIKISDQDNKAKGEPAAFATDITEDDWQDDDIDIDTDQPDLEPEVDFDDANLNDDEDEDDTTEISK